MPVSVSFLFGRWASLLVACRLVFLGLVGVRFRRGFQRSLASAHGTRVGQVCLSPCVSWFGWRARVRFLRRGFQRAGRS